MKNKLFASDRVDGRSLVILHQNTRIRALVATIDHFLGSANRIRRCLSIRRILGKHTRDIGCARQEKPCD